MHMNMHMGIFQRAYTQEVLVPSSWLPGPRRSPYHGRADRHPGVGSEKPWGARA